MEGDFHSMMRQAQLLRQHNPNALNVAFASKKEVMSTSHGRSFRGKDSSYQAEQNIDDLSSNSRSSGKNDSHSAQVSTNLKYKFLNQSFNSGDS